MKGKWLDVRKGLDISSKILHNSTDRGPHSVGRRESSEMFSKALLRCNSHTV